MVTSMAEWTSTVHIFFLSGKKCPTSFPYMGVRGSLVNNTACSERIYECDLSAITCRSESLSFSEGKAPPGQAAHKTMYQHWG